MKTITLNIKVEAEPEDVYNALTNPFALELWTGYKAEMKEEPDTEFSLWDGDIEGKNISFEKDKKIVQEWYFGEQKEQSIVTIDITGKGERSEIKVVHTNVPDEAFSDLKDGWKNYYLKGLKHFLEVED